MQHLESRQQCCMRKIMQQSQESRRGSTLCGKEGFELLVEREDALCPQVEAVEVEPVLAHRN